jgi:O-antigen ligase
MLSRVVDTGILGAAAVVFMLLAIVFATRRIINARDLVWGHPALAIAAAAVAFLVFAFLFDVTSFPHVPYILFALAGLAAVIVNGDPDPPPARAVHRLQRPVPARRVAHRPGRERVRG